MSKKKKAPRKTPPVVSPSARAAAAAAVAARRPQKSAMRVLGARTGALLHLSEPEGGGGGESRWRWLPHLLGLAFLLRALVALAGDFVIHPDEVMQYLEPAHKAAFGAGVSYWEFFYGARSWLTPGFVAGVLAAADAVGLGEPAFYIPLVKLLFCALSLLVPLGMYSFGRRHFGEFSGRAALLLGVFWYELAAFAHKPMTEFTATALLLGMLALVRAPPAGAGRAACLALIAALIAAVRIQYAPAAGLILLAEFLRASPRGRAAILAAGALGVFAVGLFEKLTWGGWFHSYLVNVRMNLIVGAARVGETTFWQFPIWLALASCGLAILALAAGAMEWRRRGWILLLALVILLPHMTQNHREYRFVFAAVPLWLMLLADFSAKGTPGWLDRWSRANWREWRKSAACLGAAVLVSLLGIFNIPPWLSPRFDPNAESRFNHLYRSFSVETGMVGFLRGQDPHFRIFRKLAADDSVEGVLEATRPYFGTGGYYYLHRAAPFYDAASWRELFSSPEEVRRYVSHIVAGPLLRVEEARGGPNGVFLTARHPDSGTDEGGGGVIGVGLPAFVPDAELGKLVYWDQEGKSAALDAFERDEEFSGGDFTLWRAVEPGGVAEWKAHRPISAGLPLARRIVGPDAPEPPQAYGVEFAESE